MKWRILLCSAQILFVGRVAFASDLHPSCELATESIVSRSSSGLAQVSNVGGIRIKCYVPARPFPTKPGGEPRPGLKATTTAYEISADGSKKSVPSEVRVFAGGGDGFGPNPEPEWVEFDMLIPLDSKELDAEARRYLAKLEASMTPEQRVQFKEGATKSSTVGLPTSCRPLPSGLPGVGWFPRNGFRHRGNRSGV